MNKWENRLVYPGLEITKPEIGQGVRSFNLVVKEVTQAVVDGVNLVGLGYNGSTPGPLLVGKQGEWIKIRVENQSQEATALHVHGYAKPNTQDGDPETEPTPLIKPGEAYTYSFYLWQSGTFFYHSTMDLQANKGLVGPLVVLPPEGCYHPCLTPYLDYILVLQEWELPQPELGKLASGNFKVDKFGIHPNFFTINGKAFPDTQPLYTEFGQKLRLRFINKSNNAHTMHLHGHDFVVVAVDGFPRFNCPQDTVNVASGNRIDVELISNNCGIWPLNGTKTVHLSNNGVTPGGMKTKLIYR